MFTESYIGIANVKLTSWHSLPAIGTTLIRECRTSLDGVPKEHKPHQDDRRSCKLTYFAAIHPCFFIQGDKPSKFY